MSLLLDLATHLQTLGIATMPETLRIDRLPPKDPDVCVVLSEYKSSEEPSGGFSVAGILHEYPMVQVICHGEPFDYEGPRALAELVYRAFAAIQGTTLSGTKYLKVMPVQSPFMLKHDDNERVQIAFNSRCFKELSV